jgi:hypothetical protein
MRLTGPATTLGQMRAGGVRWIDLFCHCGREETATVEGLPDDLVVSELRERLRCSRCGARPRQTRPHVGSTVLRGPAS